MTVATVFTNIHHSSFILAIGSSVTWSFVTIVGSWPSTNSTPSFSRSPLFLFSSSSLSDMLRSVLSELLESLLDGKGSRWVGLAFSSRISLTFSASWFKASISSDTCSPWRRSRWLAQSSSGEIPWLERVDSTHRNRKNEAEGDKEEVRSTE